MAEQHGKRKGEQSSEGNLAKRPMHSFADSGLSGQSHSMSADQAALPELVPFELVEDVTMVLPSRPFDISSGFSKQKYARDLWTIFQEEALPDPKLAEMHKEWFKVSRTKSQGLP